jgi:hypothetical protein
VGTPVRVDTVGYRLEWVRTPPPHVVVTRWGDTISDSELWFAELINDHRWQPGMTLLIDQTEAEHEAITSSDVTSIANRWSKNTEWLGDGYVAIVVSTQVHYGLTRMGQAFSRTGLHSRIFYNYDEAVAWLREVAQ